MTMPFESLRVIDLGRVWSGPLTSRILADFGAEVIKVEALAGRGQFSGAAARQVTLPEEFPNREPGEHPWNRSSMFNDLNRNKRSLTLDLSKPQGAAVFKKLAGISDMVIENYTPRVMANFGLDYPVLKAIKPGIIMLSMPAFGMTGPYHDFPGYGNTIEPVAGITDLVGYEGGEPHPLGMIAGDALAALHGASALLTALWHRERTGEGQYIDLSQAETQTSVIGEYVVAYGMNGREPERIGNRHPYMAPHGCYRCKGPDNWVVIAVNTDEEWRGLCRAIGRPAWTRDGKFAGQLSRWHNQDELDAHLEEWTIERDHYEVMRVLQKAGVACGPVLNGMEVLNDPHLNRRGFFVTLNDPEAGPHRYAGMPVRMSRTKAVFRRPAPLLGEHNREILHGLIGLTDEEIAELEREGVIGDTPPAVEDM
jgi:crotonobetainyl-CoA:carnitine CoA-transferase CaiB-like acyl-CoA transferase